VKLITPLFSGVRNPHGPTDRNLLPAPAGDANSIAGPMPFAGLRPPPVGRPSFPAADGAVVLASAAVAHLMLPGNAAISLEAAVTALFTAMLGVIALTSLGPPLPPHRISTHIWRSLAVWGGVGGLVLFLASVTRSWDPVFRQWALTWAELAVLGVVAVRTFVCLGMGWLARSGRLARSVAVVDLSGVGGERARRVAELVTEQGRLLGVWSGLRGVEDLIARSTVIRIDEVLVTSSDSNEPMLGEALRQLAEIPAGLHLWPGPHSLAGRSRKTGGICGIPATKIIDAPPSGWRAFAKRSQDIVLGLLILVVVAPVMLLVAIAIHLDSPGPILFRQRRLGFNKQEFVIYKFRSMAHRPSPEDNVPQATRADPRVTRVGAILRRTSLDELPQILNVVRGDMSLVGPRPHALAHHHLYAGLVEGYLGRHRMRPGITGWAQINGFRGETDTIEKMQSRVLYDLAYIGNWSLWLDLRILLQTVILIVLDRNAY
jgi:Undecaprenyl-phosphate glucose phosphotransferase